MRKQEFLERLEGLLWELTQGERKEALQYYIDYFEDAGISEEQDVVEEFGTPEKVAARIKVELTEEHSEYSEQGFEDIRFEENNRTMLEPVMDSFYHEEWESLGEDVIQKKEKKQKRPVHIGKILLLVGLAIFAAPILLPVIFGAFALLLALVLGALAIIGSMILGGFAVILAIGFGGLASGGILIVHGITQLFSSPSVGALSLGVGALFLAAGILGVLAIILGVGKGFPWALKGIIDLLSKIFHKGEKKV